MKIRIFSVVITIVCLMFAACSFTGVPPYFSAPWMSETSAPNESIQTAVLVTPSEAPTSELFIVSPPPSGGFDPEKAKDYLIDAINSKTLNTEINYEDSLNGYKNENGVLFLDCTRWYSINVNDARRYLKDTYNLSDKDILSLTLFEDYIPVTEELGQDYKESGYSEASDLCYQGIPPADPYAQDLSLWSEDLGYVEVSKDAKISILDENIGELKNIGYNEFIDWITTMYFEYSLPCDIVITNGVVTEFTDYSWAS